MGVAQASKLSQESDYEIEEDEEYYVTRPHSSVRRYNQPVERDTLDDADISKGASVHPRRTHVDPYPNSGKLSHAAAPSWRQDWRQDTATTVAASKSRSQQADRGRLCVLRFQKSFGRARLHPRAAQSRSPRFRDHRLFLLAAARWRDRGMPVIG